MPHIRNSLRAFVRIPTDRAELRRITRRGIAKAMLLFGFICTLWPLIAYVIDGLRGILK